MDTSTLRRAKKYTDRLFDQTKKTTVNAYLPFELGTIDVSGANLGSSTIARSTGFLTFNYNQLCNLIADPNIKFKVYSYALDGSFKSIITGNMVNSYMFRDYGANCKYRITIWFADNRTLNAQTVANISKLFYAQITTLDTVIENNVSVLNMTYSNAMKFGMATKYFSDLSYNSYGLLSSDYINSEIKTLFIRCTNPVYLFRIIKYTSAGVQNDVITGLSSYTINDDGFLYKIHIYRADAATITANYLDALRALQVFVGSKPILFNNAASQYADLVKYNVMFNAPYGNLKAVVGHELNIYFDDFISINRPNDIRYEVLCSTLETDIKHFPECIRITPTSANIGTHTITINVRTIDWSLIGSATITLTVIADISLATSKKVMFLGDSLTESGTIQTTVKDMFGDNFTLYGTRGTAPYLHEGRSGWAAYDYTHAASKNSVTNPFWNPSTSAFDFSYYMTNNPSFSGVGYVNIYLGQNDGYSSNGISAIQTIINSIKAYNSSIVVTVCTIHILPDDNSGTGQYMQNVYDYRNRARLFNDMLNTSIGSMSGVNLIPTHLNIDTKYDYPHSQVAVSARNTETVLRYTDNVHPATPGYQKIADVLYNWYVSLFS